MSSINDNIKFELTKSQKNIISSYVDKEGKISCIDSFKAAKKCALEVKRMSTITKSMGLRISDCQLGMFGKLDLPFNDETIYDEITLKFDGEKKLDCKTYWEEAKKSNLHRVGSTVKNSDLDVVNCQLGCFRLREGKKDGC